MKTIVDLKTLQSTVRKAVADVTISDIHTHLFPPSHRGLFLWGIDEMLTYHYLVSEMFIVAPRELTAAKFFKLSKSEQADIVWDELFIRRTPISESARGVVLTLRELGLDPKTRDLGKARRWFAGRKAEKHVADIFRLANLDSVTMTNDPFAAEEIPYWTKAGSEKSDRKKDACEAFFKPALRCDTLITKYAEACRAMAAQGYDTGESVNEERRIDQARKFLADWAGRIKPLYMAASLPSTFRYPEGEHARILDKIVLPAARELGLPMALMIGVKRQINPAMGLAGDAAGISDVQVVQNLAQANGDVKFPITLIARDNQHELCIQGVKFPNLHIFGCWWFCNQKSIIQEITRERLEMLGSGFTAQHSDARVMEQLVYKWSEARRIIGEVLVEKYTDLHQAGWRVTKEEIARDVRRLFGGSFEEFLAK